MPVEIFKNGDMAGDDSAAEIDVKVEKVSNAYNVIGGSCDGSMLGTLRFEIFAKVGIQFNWDNLQDVLCFQYSRSLNYVGGSVKSALERPKDSVCINSSRRLV